MNSNVFRNLSYGVYVISSLDNGRHTGCIANSIMQVTSEKATVALSMNHDNFTNSCIAASGRFAVSILSESSDPSLIGRFGFQSGRNVNKFDGVSFSLKEGLPVIDDSCGYIICNVIDKLETSTHTVFLGEVMDGEPLGTAPAMTYSYYHKVVKGKSPKNAPTYLPEDASSDTRSEAETWVCSVCGYVYDGSAPFESLPDSYTCPICRQDKARFKKQ